MAIPSHYKLVAEHPASYEIHDERDGKKFHIAKSGLNLEMHGKLSKIQKFDDGGIVQVATDPSSAQINPSLANPESSSQEINYGPLIQKEQSENAPYGTAPTAPSPQQTGPSPASVPSNNQPVPQTVDPVAAQAQAGNDALKAERAAILAGAGAEGAQNQQTAQAYKDYAAKIDQQLTPQQIFQNHKAADDQLLKAYMDKTVDPNRYFKNQGTGAKISSALGMLFSGIGAARTGQPNYAMEAINNAVNRDIEAQRQDQSKTMNLWKMNREATQDETQANLATQNQLLNSVKAKALQYEAQYAGPVARAKIAPMLAQIDQQMALNNRNRALLSASNSGGQSQIDPEKLVPMLVPQEHQKQALTEIGQAKAAVGNENSIRDAFMQAAKDTRPATGRSLTSVLNTVPGYTPPSIKALNLLYDPLIHDNEGRINELEQKHVQANSPQFGDSDDTVQKKWQAIQDFINHKKQAVTANAFGINPARFSSTAGAPPAPQIKTVNGIKYMRGPNGQAIPVK